MQTARRAYVYFISAVSLGVLTVGLANLLGLAFNRLAEALGWRTVVSLSAGELRREVSLYAALVVVALPIWLVHWWLAERSIWRDDASSETERRSTIRSLYLALVLMASVIVWIVSAINVLQFGFLKLFDSREAFVGGVPLSLGLMLVVSGIWAYHVWVRLRDLRAGPLASDAVELPRLYRYLAMFVGAMLLLTGAVQLLNLLGDAVFGTGRLIVAGERWWARPLTEGITTLLVGFAVWAVHWRYSVTVLERDDWQARSERQSMLRRGYLYLVVLVAAVGTLFMLGSGLETPLRAILSVPESPGAAQFARHVFEPLAGALPFAAFWWFHRQRIEAESLRFGGAAVQTSALRFYRYLVSLIGLAFTGVGTAYVAGILIDLVFSGSRTVNPSAPWWRGQVSQYGAIALVGAAVWLWHWYALQVTRAAAPEAEGWTTSRRFYLYGVLAASLVATLAGLSVILYRLFNLLLNVTPSGGFISSISAAAGVAAIAVGVLVYHGLVLWHDMQARPAAVAGLAALPLELTGPAGADFDSELNALRDHLHQGFELRRPRQHA